MGYRETGTPYLVIDNPTACRSSLDMVDLIEATKRAYEEADRVCLLAGWPRRGEEWWRIAQRE